MFVLYTKFDGVITPCGTAFAIATAEKNMLLTASHVVSPHRDQQWCIALSFERDASGWHPVGAHLPVELVYCGDENVDDVAVLKLSGVNLFADKDMMHVCPADCIPVVSDEAKFKTYYCPIADIANDDTFPSLEVAPSTWKTAFSIDRKVNGKMWIRDALCGGSSGGVVVDLLGRAVAVHSEAASSSKSVDECIKCYKNTNPNKVVDMESVLSDAVTSLGETHTSSQICPILCFSLTVREALGLPSTT